MKINIKKDCVFGFVLCNWNCIAFNFGTDKGKMGQSSSYVHCCSFMRGTYSGN